MVARELNKPYTLKSLLGYAAPTIAVMLFVSIYTMVDGIFVARYVNATALSAINIFLPIYTVIFAIALMIGTGGSAIIAKKMGGENKYEEARSNFTFIVLCGIFIGLLISVLGLIFIRPLLEFLGAGSSEQLFEYTLTYGKIILLFSPFLIVQMMFENFFVTSGKPKLSLVITLFGGIVNIVLDYFFIVILDMEIKGAAIATVIGIVIPSSIGIAYFILSKNRGLYFVKPRIDGKVFLNTCLNGSSEMVTNLSSSVVTLAFNLLMLHYIGVDGVAAVTIMLYLMMFLTPVFMGYSVGIAPIISYKYGSQQINQLQFIVKKSLFIIGISSFAIVGLSYVLGPVLIEVMVGKGSNVYSIAIDGFRIFCISFLFMGLNIFTSMLFTALSNGKISAIISFLRTLVFVLIGLLLLPLIFGGVKGIWIAIPLAESLSIIVCIYFLIRKRKVYDYF